jgi:hypothetical protein
MAMNLKPIVVLFAVIALPLLAQAQQGGQKPPNVPKPTAADVQRVVAMIRADKAKLQNFCDLAKIDDQIAQAEQAKDTKKADELDKKAEEMAQKIGPDYINLMSGLEQMDHSSKETQQLTTPFDVLVKTCPK